MTRRLWVSLAILFGLILIGLAVYFYLQPPAGRMGDWGDYFRPATMAFLSGQSPYSIQGIFNPPWTFLILAPIAWLPVKVGFAIWFALGILAISYTVYKLGAGPLQASAFLVSFPMLFSLTMGQLDWLILLGMVCPPWLGMFLVLIKPQLGFTMAIFWIVQAFRRNGWRDVVRLAWPISLAFLVSFALYGFYLGGTGGLASKMSFSLFPLAIPVGLALLVWGIRSDRKETAAGAALFLTPYMPPYSLWLYILPWLPYRRLMVVFSISLSGALLAKSLGLW